MLLVKPPDPQFFVELLQGLQTDSYTREEVVSWQEAVVSECGWRVPLSVEQGFWYFYSLAYLLVPGIFDEPGFFIRNADIQEYLLDIDLVAGDFERPGLRHLRAHELDREAIRWPLKVISANQGSRCTNETGALPTVRGIFEQGDALVEHTHLEFMDVTYLIVREYREYGEEAMILGTDRDEQKLAKFIAAIEF